MTHAATIADFDSRVLSLLRELWLDAKDDATKTKMRGRIDDALDERLRLMRLRDAA